MIKIKYKGVSFEVDSLDKVPRGAKIVSGAPPGAITSPVAEPVVEPKPELPDEPEEVMVEEPVVDPVPELPAEPEEVVVEEPVLEDDAEELILDEDDLREKTKRELVLFAKKELGLELSKKSRKDDLIKAIMDMAEEE